MKQRRVLPIDRLVQFCQENDYFMFSAKDTGFSIAVSVPATFDLEKYDDEDLTHRGLVRLRFKVAHIGQNRNKTYISEENMKKAMPSLKNRPILAAIHQLDDGSWDFHKHDAAENEDGEVEYIETQVGNFTEDDPVLEYDKEMDKTYVVAYGVVAEEYTKAAEIIREKGGTKNSCELCVDSFVYNAKEGYLELQDFYFSGSTLLGSEKDGTEIGEGMLGSRADIVDFAINETQGNPCFHKENSKEGGQGMTKMDELLQKYNKSLEDITFEYDGMTDEELEAKFAELFDGESDGSSSDQNGGALADPPATDDNTTPGEDDDKDDDEEEKDPEEDEASTDPTPKKKVDNTFTVGNVNYELSLGEKDFALYQLVNAVYADADNTWYGVISYEDYVIMEDWCTGQLYRQSYSQDGDELTLTGDRVRVYAVYVTEEERTELENMRANYASLVEFKDNADRAASREEKLNSVSDEKYAVIKNEKSYKDLVKKIDDYSLTDFEKEVKLILFEYREKHPITDSNHKVNFDLNEQTKKKKAYGNLFD